MPTELMDRIRESNAASPARPSPPAANCYHCAGGPILDREAVEAWGYSRVS